MGEDLDACANGACGDEEGLRRRLARDGAGFDAVEHEDSIGAGLRERFEDYHRPARVGQVPSRSLEPLRNESGLRAHGSGREDRRIRIAEPGRNGLSGGPLILRPESESGTGHRAHAYRPRHGPRGRARQDAEPRGSGQQDQVADDAHGAFGARPVLTEESAAGPNAFGANSSARALALDLREAVVVGFERRRAVRARCGGPGRVRRRGPGGPAARASTCCRVERRLRGRVTAELAESAQDVLTDRG